MQCGNVAGYRVLFDARPWLRVSVPRVQACLISMIDIANHLMHFSEKVLQTYMIRIMWMVPIYAVESWLSLRFKHAAIYIETARECCTSGAHTNTPTTPHTLCLRAWIGVVATSLVCLRCVPLAHHHHHQ